MLELVASLGQVPATLSARMARRYAESEQVPAAGVAERTDPNTYPRRLAMMTPVLVSSRAAPW